MPIIAEAWEDLDAPFVCLLIQGDVAYYHLDDFQAPCMVPPESHEDHATMESNRDGSKRWCEIVKQRHDEVARHIELGQQGAKATQLLTDHRDRLAGVVAFCDRVVNELDAMLAASPYRTKGAR